MMKSAFPLIALMAFAVSACSSKEAPPTPSASDTAATTESAPPAEAPGDRPTATPTTVTNAAPAAGHVPPKALTQAFIDRQTAAARTAAKALGAALKSELQAAMRDGGPVSALSVCHDKAAAISREISEQQGMKISRVSLKNRNPANQAVGWTEQALKDFERAKRAGEDINQLEFTEIVEINGQHQFRYMKAIPTGKVCLACHGANLSPEVREKLHSLYPSDKATGFQVGDIRGAFVVTKSL